MTIQDLETLTARREAIVMAHIEAESNHDIEATLKTFHHARYEVMPFGDPTDGEEAVRGLLAALMTAFPDFRAECKKLFHSDRTVIVEALMTGSQQGEWLGQPPSGKRFACMAACIFEFDGDKLICERVYFDNASMLSQISAK